MRPVDAITLREAAAILGTSVSSVRRVMLAGQLPRGDRYEQRWLSRGDVEKLATEVYAWRRHVHDDGSYWITGQGAADVLGLSRARLNQLAMADRVPFELHTDGVRLYRRAQLRVMARSCW